MGGLFERAVGSRRRESLLAFCIVAGYGADAWASEPNAQRVNHFVGAAGASVGIQVPAFHGIEPRLSLSYSSEARNGFAGKGWDLTGFSVIERVNGTWGAPQFSSTDVFTLDGQTLLECVPEASSYPSCATGGTHYTQQESYLRIKKISDVLWEVYGKDGTKTEFAPIHTVPLYEGGPTYSLRLGQSKVVDTHGNTVNYNWNVNLDLNDQSVNGATYPASVTYSGYAIEFVRESRPEGALTRGLWSDIGRQAERLSSILVRRTGTPGTPIRAYKLGYQLEPVTGRSLLASVQMYGNDFVIDSVTGVITGTALPAQTFTYGTDAAASSFTGDVQMSTAGPPATPAGTIENTVWVFQHATTTVGYGNTLQSQSVPGDVKYAYSSRALSAGGGYAEFTHSAGSHKYFYFGQYGLYMAPNNGGVYPIANGAIIGGPWAVGLGSVLRIQVAPAGVAFWANGVLLGSYSYNTAYPLNIAASIYGDLEQIVDARLSGALVNTYSADCAGAKRWAGDFNGDGRQDSVCATAAGNVVVTLATLAGFANPVMWASSSFPLSGVGDFNNDGRDDVVFFDSFWGQTYAGLSNVQNFGAITPWGFLGGYGDGCRMNGATLGKVADYNGDGRMDVACYTPGVDLQYVGLSTGTSFVGVLFGESGCPAPYGNIPSQGQADFNGDGRDDWFCMNTATADVMAFLSSGSFLYNNGGSLTGFCSVNEYTFGDWNGDGATDAACANNLRAGLQTGRKFAVLEAPSPAAYCVSGQRLAADLDGDGAAEWICNNPGTPSNDIEVRRWSGLAFGAAQTWRGSFCGGTLAAADFNGDGKKDLLCESTGAVIYAGTKDVKADLMIGADNGIGGVSTIQWGTTTMVAQSATGGQSYAGLPAKYLITETSVDDGRTGARTTRFIYQSGAQNDEERKFFGFATVKELLPPIGTESAIDPPMILRKFRTDKLLAGRLEEVSRWDGSGPSAKVISLTKNEYTTTETTGAGSRRTALLTTVWNYKYTGEGGLCPSFPCSTAKRTKTEFFYDGYGNMVGVKDYGEIGALDGSGSEALPLSGDETLTSYFFVPNTGPYIVGLVGAVNRWTGTAQAGDKLISSTINFYDNAGAWAVAPTKGDLTSTQSWIKEKARYSAAATRTYDAYGNITSMTDPTGRTQTILYDGLNLFPSSTTQGSETTFTTFNLACGVVETLKDPNDVTTTFTPDALCRPSLTQSSAAGTVETRTYTAAESPALSKVRVETPGSDGQPDWVESHFDGFGRAYKTVRRGPGGKEIVTETAFDARGNIASQTAPYYANAGAPETPVKTTTFSYDRYDRRTLTRLPDNKEIMTTYGALNGGLFPTTQSQSTTLKTGGTAVTQSTTTLVDVGGRVRTTSQCSTNQACVNTTRDYDVSNRLIEVRDHLDNAWTYTYDTLGRNIAKDDPDAGVWTYDYDDAGRLVTQIDAKAQATTLEYDALGRLRFQRIRPSGGAAGTVESYVETAYGNSAASYNVGRVAELTRKDLSGTDLGGRLSFEYDALGRVTKQTRRIGGAGSAEYVVEKEYAPSGYLQGIKYPDGDIVGKFGATGVPLGYDEAGRLTHIEGSQGGASYGILNNVTYNAMGAPLVQTNANSTTTTKAYDPDRFWLTGIVTTGPTVLQDLHYTPNDTGMVLGVDAFGATPSNEDWAYEYDGLNRLISSTNGASASDNQTWAYDEIGRIQTNSRAGAYGYPPATNSARPHAPISIDSGPLGALTFSYDNNGNMQTGNGRTNTFNARNQIVRVVVGSGTTAKSTDFTYGPDGTRIKKVLNGATVALYPFGDDYEIDASGTVTKYFNAGFGVIAKKVGTTRYWLHTDRLGSVNAITDDTGAEVLRRSYRSYGALLGEARPSGGAHADSLGYIGQRADQETKNTSAEDDGLTYLHARYYDPVLGIFLSPDPSLADLNTYRYSGADPVNYSDILGLERSKDDEQQARDACNSIQNPESKDACNAALNRAHQDGTSVTAHVDDFNDLIEIARRIDREIKEEERERQERTKPKPQQPACSAPTVKENFELLNHSAGGAIVHLVENTHAAMEAAGVFAAGGYYGALLRAGTPAGAAFAIDSITVAVSELTIIHGAELLGGAATVLEAGALVGSALNTLGEVIACGS